VDGRVRDVVLLGAAGAGKSTLAAALLGAPCPPPEPGALAHGVLEHRGVRVHLLDPPGEPDLAGRLEAGLRAAGAVLLVVSPVQGVDARTVALWERCEAAGLPRVVVLTALDRPGADADEAMAVCQRVLGEGVLPLQLPLHDDDGTVSGVLDLPGLQMHVPGEPACPADPEHERLVEGLRDELLEAALTGSADEQLFQAWLGGAEPSPDVLTAELARAVGTGELAPVAVAVPRTGAGVEQLRDLLVDLLPGPTHLPCPPVTGPDGAPAGPLCADPAGPLVAEVVRGGPTCLVRVWSGTLVRGAPVVVAGRGPVAASAAGRPGELVELAVDAAPGEAVCAPGTELLLAAWPAASAQLPVGVPADEGLARRVAADPVARLETDPRTGQRLLWATGPAHAELLLAGLPSQPVRVPPGARPRRVRVRMPAWCARTVRSDLVGRGGEVLASSQDEHGEVLEALLPPSELPGYALALARASSCTASFEPVLTPRRS